MSGRASNKIRKLERNRTSILTDDLSHCYICGRYGVHLHEIYFGSNRKNSMKYGCVVPLCQECHLGYDGAHNNRELDLKLKRECQERFLKIYDEDFIKIFGRNYL